MGGTLYSPGPKRNGAESRTKVATFIENTDRRNVCDFCAGLAGVFLPWIFGAEERLGDNDWFTAIQSPAVPGLTSFSDSSHVSCSVNHAKGLSEN